MQVAGLFNGERSEGVHTSMLEVSFTQHSLQVIQDRAIGVVLCTLHTLHTGLVQQQQSVMLQGNVNL